MKTDNQDPKQDLIDLCFQLVLIATNPKYQDFFKDKSDEEKAIWVADKLLQAGYYTRPVGISWGILQEDRNKK